MIMRRLVPSLLCAASLSAGLSGCVVGPDFQRPASPTTQAYLRPAEQGATQIVAGEAPVRWWTAFGSPELDALVDRAIANNPSLAASNATLARAAAELAAARGTALPQVGANARVEHEQVNLASFGLKPGSLAGVPGNPEFNLYTVGAGVSYDLDLFGGRRRLIERAGAETEAQLRRTQAAHLALAGQVVTQVINIAAIRSQIAAVESLIADDQRNVDLIDRRRRGGEGTVVQVLSARSQLAADQTELAPLRQSLSRAEHLLATLVGAAPADFAAPVLALDSFTVPAAIPVVLPSALVHRRPDILQAEADLHAATAAIGVATARLYPDITLGATLAQASPQTGAIFKSASQGFDIFAGLTAPIFNGGALRAGKRAAVEDARAANGAYQQTVLKAFAQVADLMTALTYDQQDIDAHRGAIAITQRSLDLSRRSFAVGNSNVLDVLDAERIHQRSRAGLVVARARQLTDAAQLFAATAGGWTGVPDDGLAAPR